MSLEDNLIAGAVIVVGLALSATLAVWIVLDAWNDR